VRRTIYPIIGLFVGAVVNILFNLIAAAIQNRAIGDQFSSQTTWWLIGFATIGLLVGYWLSIRSETLPGGDVTVQQFVSNDSSHRQQITFFINDLDLQNTQPDKYAQSQFDAYCRIWRSFQALRLLGDDLWKIANTETITKFAKQLRGTELMVREDEIFLEENDRRRLLRILSAFGDFRIGKMRLIEVRSEEDVKGNISSANRIQRQIEQNRIYKTHYEELLDDVRISFKQRLSNQSVHEQRKNEKNFPNQKAS